MEIFRDQIAPLYLPGKRVRLALQEGLAHVHATVWWDAASSAYVLLLCPSGDVVADARALLHEVGHVAQGHVPRGPRPPSWVLSGDRIDEARLLRVLEEGGGGVRAPSDKQLIEAAAAGWAATEGRRLGLG